MTDGRVWVAHLDEVTPDLNADALFACGWLVATVKPGTGPIYNFLDPACWPIRDYAYALSHMVPRLTFGDLPMLEPLGAIAHRDVTLPPHTDKRSPAGTCWNATLLDGYACEGGALAIGDLHVHPLRSLLVIFDPQREHHVEPFLFRAPPPVGYRLSLTIYLGEK